MMDILKDEVIQKVSRRLISGNSTPCDSARISREEWIAVLRELQGLDYEMGYIAEVVEPILKGMLEEDA